MPIDPLHDLPMLPTIASLPKADLHVHQEDAARFERVAAQRFGRPPYNPRPWIQQMMVETLPGMGRIGGVYAPDQTFDFHGMAADDPANIIAKMVDAMLEGAKDGAVLVELRFGAGSTAFIQPDFMALFREAERQVQAQYPGFRSEAICYLGIWNDPLQLQTVENQFAVCLKAAREGLGGVDFRVDPYDTEADPASWEFAYELAERAVDAGLGITTHAGEFSTGNIMAALRTPGVSRLGHAVFAAADARILEATACSGVTVECSLTCNVVSGCVAAYEQHPIRQLAAAGIPVTLNTDLPVHLRTTIGREYAIAAELGFSTAEIFEFTRSAIRASFMPEARRRQVMEEIQFWSAENR